MSILVKKILRIPFTEFRRTTITQSPNMYIYILQKMTLHEMTSRPQSANPPMEKEDLIMLTRR